MDLPSQTVPSLKSFPCPTCKQPSQWTDNPNRPFCSARCKEGDFLDWVNETHRIPADESPLSSLLEEE